MKKFDPKSVTVYTDDSRNAIEWYNFFKECKKIKTYAIVKEYGEWIRDFKDWMKIGFEAVELNMGDYTIWGRLIGDVILYTGLSDENVYCIFDEVERVG
ncbi:MAG: hypothetical protein J6T77_02660 [Clostridia bacterium]|nr:hypothetical protein [Clostridia bacterium]